VTSTLVCWWRRRTRGTNRDIAFTGAPAPGDLTRRIGPGLERVSRPGSSARKEPITREVTPAHAGADHPQAAGGRAAGRRGKTIPEAAKELEISEQTFHPDAAGEVARQIDTHASETAFIEPGSPWQNAYVESFNGRVRDELLDIEEFSCLADARVVIVPAASAHHAALNTRPGVTRSRPMAPTPDAARAPRRVPPLGRWLRREYSSRSR
jgi:hypothetical protein